MPLTAVAIVLLATFAGAALLTQSGNEE